MARLADILRDPVLHAALEIVKQEGFPRLPEALSGVSYGEQVAAHGAYAAGWQRALQALESLVLKPSLTPRILTEPQFDEAARTRMRASGLYTEEEISQL